MRPWESKVWGHGKVKSGARAWHSIPQNRYILQLLFLLWTHHDPYLQVNTNPSRLLCFFINPKFSRWTPLQFNMAFCLGRCSRQNSCAQWLKAVVVACMYLGGLSVGISYVALYFPSSNLQTVTALQRLARIIYVRPWSRHSFSLGLFPSRSDKGSYFRLGSKQFFGKSVVGLPKNPFWSLNSKTLLTHNPV